ncbi:MAG TPA: LemA family protein [Bauldia sp.]|nr:LemA family protein [Bauldia sp.]
MVAWIVLAIAAVIVVIGVFLYNRLVRTQQMANEGWSGIDVQLKRRADLIPNLVDTVKGYASHERTLFDEVTRLRAEAARIRQDDVTARGAAEGKLSAAVGQLLALAEAYPDLKASENFGKLQTELATVEDEIQMARRYYNGAVRNLNIMVESFPSNFVAQLFGFRLRDYFEIEDGDRAVPQLAFKG